MLVTRFDSAPAGYITGAQQAADDSVVCRRTISITRVAAAADCCTVQRPAPATLRDIIIFHIEDSPSLYITGYHTLHDITADLVIGVPTVEPTLFFVSDDAELWSNEWNYFSVVGTDVYV